MKTFTIVLLCSIAFTAKADDQIQIVRHGTNVTERPSTALATNVIEYLQSCSIYSTAYAVKANTWSDREHSDSFVRLTFVPPKQLKVTIWADDDPGITNIAQWNYKRQHTAISEVKSIDQILVPLPVANLPDHVFARSGTNVFSFTKMDPHVLKKIVLEPALHLSSVYPYSLIAKFPDK